MGQGFGDRLARGGNKATFATTDKPISDEKWEQAFKDFDIDKFREAGDDEDRRRNAHDETDGNASAVAGEALVNRSSE